MMRDLLRGAAAGAAGTAALNATTYLDMAVRGRPPSQTPQQTVAAASKRVGMAVPGEGATRQNRLAGLGELSGIGTGVGLGAAIGGLRRLGVRPGSAAGAVFTSLAAMAVANVPMVLLGVTDPRRWSSADWLSDLVPHVMYGVVTSATLAALARSRSSDRGRFRFV